MMNLNSLDYRVVFYGQTNDGPEAGMMEQTEVYACWADMYEPTQKDVQLGNLESTKKSVTLNIRDAYPEYVPKTNEIFTFESGMYNGLSFNIKHIALAKTPGYLKVVGEEL